MTLLDPLATNALVLLALAPYLRLAWRDEVLHRRARRVTRLEQLLHLAVLGALVLGVSAVFRRDVDRALLGAVLFVPPALLDEFVFHRGIPLEEHAVHAKQHLLLLVFVVVSTLVLANGI